MIVDDRFTVNFVAMQKNGDGWLASVRLFPDPASLKSAAELEDPQNKESKQLRAITLLGKGPTHARAFASALAAVASHVIACETEKG